MVWCKDRMWWRIRSCSWDFTKGGAVVPGEEGGGEPGLGEEELEAEPPPPLHQPPQPLYAHLHNQLKVQKSSFKH